MGTRADFYVGSGKDAEWLGSVAWDGYEWEDEETDIAKATTEDEYRKAVKDELATRDDSTMPIMGWPWPWENSQTTDYVYWFENGKVFNDRFSKREWPDMTDKTNVQFGGRRSGLMVASINNGKLEID